MKNSLDRPKLPPSFREQLVEIEPSREGAVKYFPCDVVLKTGERVDCVYLISLTDYVKLWRFYPDRGRDKGFVDVEDIASVADSRSRLPAKFANILHACGESGMGYCIFTVEFRSGFKQAYLVGDFAVDFVRYPDGLGKEDVVNVSPHSGRDMAHISGHAYSACFPSETHRCLPVPRANRGETRSGNTAAASRNSRASQATFPQRASGRSEPGILRRGGAE